jgi:arabinose-5-phosphate isomerase
MKIEAFRTQYAASALKTLDIEMQALATLRAALQSSGLSSAVEKVINTFASTRGRIIVTGMGKSGHIARKIAATMRSTGTSALFLHPGEASHGDLGVIGQDDVVLAITWSGETKELNDIFHYCRHYGVELIVATAHPDSTAGRAADICLQLPVVREACPNELAPTSSTTLQLVLGDALAVALIEARGFTPSDFRVFHPGGRLGAQLATVSEIMGIGEAIPRVHRNATLVNATLEMSRKRYGCTAVVDENDVLVGVFTDGDLRRCIVTNNLSDTISDHMSTNPVTVPTNVLLPEALRLMNDNAVSVLFVIDAGKLVGVVHMHDIVGAGIA